MKGRTGEARYRWTASRSSATYLSTRLRPRSPSALSTHLVFRGTPGLVSSVPPGADNHHINNTYDDDANGRLANASNPNPTHGKTDNALAVQADLMISLSSCPCISMIAAKVRTWYVAGCRVSVSMARIHHLPTPTVGMYTSTCQDECTHTASLRFVHPLRTCSVVGSMILALRLCTKSSRASSSIPSTGPASQVRGGGSYPTLPVTSGKLIGIGIHL